MPLEANIFECQHIKEAMNPGPQLDGALPSFSVHAILGMGEYQFFKNQIGKPSICDQLVLENTFSKIIEGFTLIMASR